MTGPTPDKNYIGKGQNTMISVAFNEAMGTAPTVTITGQNMDPVTAVKMTLASDGLSASYVYQYADADNNATSGPVTITVSGAKDIAGNVAGTGVDNTLGIDLVIPTVLAVTLPLFYDYIDKFKLGSVTIASTGSQSGTVYYSAVLPGKVPTLVL